MAISIQFNYIQLLILSNSFLFQLKSNMRLTKKINNYNFIIFYLDNTFLYFKQLTLHKLFKTIKPSLNSLHKNRYIAKMVN